MMWGYSPDYTVNGRPLLDSGEEAERSYSDLDSADSGRDESGVMHRQVLREKVGTWSFCYPLLDAEDYAYLKSLFDGQATFIFGHPEGSCTAYMSKYSILVKSHRTGLYKNMKFNIIEC